MEPDDLVRRWVGVHLAPEVDIVPLLEAPQLNVQPELHAHRGRVWVKQLKLISKLSGHTWAMELYLENELLYNSTKNFTTEW